MNKQIKNKITLKQKILNQIMLSGNKKTSEKLLLKSFKELQKKSKKQSKKIIQISLINFMPLFKLHEISNKKLKKKQRKTKVIPSFITKTFSRTSLGIKFLIQNIKKETNSTFFNQLNLKILSSADNKKPLFENKTEMIKKVLENKRYLKNYRW